MLHSNTPSLSSIYEHNRTDMTCSNDKDKTNGRLKNTASIVVLQIT